MARRQDGQLVGQAAGWAAGRLARWPDGRAGRLAGQLAGGRSAWSLVQPPASDLAWLTQETNYFPMLITSNRKHKHVIFFVFPV